MFCLLAEYKSSEPPSAPYLDDALPLVRVRVEQRRPERRVDVDGRAHHVEHHVDAVLWGL